MGLFGLREQPQREPGERDGASGDVPAYGSDQDGRPHDGDVLDRLRRDGSGAQYDRDVFQVVSGPLRLRTGGSWRQLAPTCSPVSGGRRSAAHFGSVPVEVGGNSPPPAPLYPVGGDQPKVNAGSPTYPVDVSAALTSDGKFLTVAVINANESAQAFDLGI